MKLGTVLAVLAVVGMVGVALAQDANTATSRPARPLMGQVIKVQDANVVVKPMVGRRGADANAVTEVTVVTDAKTVITVDGKDAKVADLKADLYVVVTPATGTATKIVATKDRPTPPAGGGRRGGAAPAAPAN
jgi:hypothetical protein